jgi:hypothetical protein
MKEVGLGRGNWGVRRFYGETGTGDMGGGRLSEGTGAVPSVTRLVNP